MEKYVIKGNASKIATIDFEKKVINIQCNASYAQRLLFDVEVPFDDITAFVVKKPALGAGFVSLIVRGKDLYSDTGSNFSDTSLTQVHLQSKGYNQYMEAINRFLREFRNVPVEGKGESTYPKVKYKEKDCPYAVGSRDIPKKCNVCGHIFCYTQMDLKKNLWHAKNAKLYSLSSLGGTYASSASDRQSADMAISQIVDYNKCPKCGSRNLSDATDEDLAKLSAGENNSQAVSPADELKKYKELLDMEVITQEEFDAKKKQLLGL